MPYPIRILLQTTIEPNPDDWDISRFSLLAGHLASLRNADGAPRYAVTARDRGPCAAPDPVLSTLDRSSHDQLWLLAVDTGDGLHAEDAAGIARFHAGGRGLMVTRDHMDLGCSIRALGAIGRAHFFHSYNVDPDPARHCIDDRETTAILWPNYHSGANGDAQEIVPVGRIHPLLRDAAGGTITRLPAHPHEGAVGVPSDASAARVIATGSSQTTGRDFNIAVAFEASEGTGRGLAQSTFHHFADYNWDPARGCPSFVTERSGDGMRTDPEAARMTRRYVENIAAWLAGGENR
jgi:hypothetical protein